MLKSLATQFNRYITTADITGISSLICDDHRFVDSDGNEIIGRDAVEQAWASFFESFPDYRNLFIDFASVAGGLAIAGHSICYDRKLEGDALWLLRERDGKIAEWRVYDDTEANRKQLNLPIREVEQEA